MLRAKRPNAPANRIGGAHGRETQRLSLNHKVPSSIPGSGCQLLGFSLAHIFGASTSTGVVPRKHNRENLVQVVKTCLLIDVKYIMFKLN